MEEELIEGNLQLKYSAKYCQAENGGWRHNIKDGENDRDILPGAYMEIKLIDNHLGEWIKGRYEARLTEPIEAYLSIGYAQVTIPLGTTIRVRKNN